MFSISKIQSKSKSQLTGVLRFTEPSCVQYFKDTIQKQITTGVAGLTLRFTLCSVFQRYNPKANHNSVTFGIGVPSLCSVFQRYNPKANHNFGYALVTVG